MIFAILILMWLAAFFGVLGGFLMDRFFAIGGLPLKTYRSLFSL
jgi:hypothetical protein